MAEKYDLDHNNECVSTLKGLLQAYTDVVTGNQTVEVRFNDRWTTYTKANVAALSELYRLLYTGCRGAEQAGLPSLNPGERSRRGAPTRGYWNFPRL